MQGSRKVQAHAGALAPLLSETFRPKSSLICELTQRLLMGAPSLVDLIQAALSLESRLAHSSP